MNTITEKLHAAFVKCGEILPPADIARLVQEYEFDQRVELDEKTLLEAVRDAGERFVDSMQGNTSDDDELARWEAMRPSVMRRKTIERALASA